MGDPSLIVPTENVDIKDSLSNEEILVQIIDRQIRKLRQRMLYQSKSLGGINLLKKRLGKLRRI